MARVSGERAPAFTSEELEKLVDGVLPEYTLLYGPPDKQVSAHQTKDIWRAIAKGVRTLGVYHRRSTHCRKKWKDIRRWSNKTAEAQLGMASQHGRGARRTMTPLMFRILAVAYPELVGRLRASQQPQGGQPVWQDEALWLPWHQKLASARRERGKTPATKAAPRGPGGSVESAVTSSKVGKGPQETREVWEEQHGGEDRHHPRCPGQARQYKPSCRGQDRQHKPSCRGQDREHKPNCPGQDRQHKPRWPGQDRQHKPSCTGQDRQHKPSCRGQDRQHKPSYPGQDRQHKPSCRGQDCQHKPTCPGGSRQHQPTCPGGHRQNKPRWAMKDRQQKPRWAMKDRQQLSPCNGDRCPKHC
ncbi:hypothetical protein NDU88_008082 [Pleurodeles waltl]|uniref:Myb/SANT-like DNA-binding domain-containing protein n=1 Tax=Pleurodeles waltl TaxID=8319 RepID=A0AAV7RRZ2_PLEWA|nr:hypothetical protein NDU88_008082 [Pleurodeles waltl]